MPISTDYRLPGVYTQEVSGPRLSTSATGGTVVAFVGPGIGYRSASQRVAMTGTDSVALTNVGVDKSSVTITSASGGTTFEQGAYEVTLGPDNAASVSRKLSQLKGGDKADLTDRTKSFTFYTAQPVVDLHDEETDEWYVVRGSVRATMGEEETALEEGTDFAVDYHTGEFSAMSGGQLANGKTVTVKFCSVAAEPVELVGEVSYTLTHKFIAKDGMSGDSGKYSLKLLKYTFQEDVAASTATVSDGNYREDVDFVIDYDSGRIARMAGSSIPSFNDTEAPGNDSGTLLYAEFAYCPIQDGQSVVISYHYTGDAYYSATWCDSYNDVRTNYGDPWSATTGEPTSLLSVAAYIATQNGLGGCYCAAVRESEGGSYSLNAWADAFDRLTVVQGIDVVVPLSGDQAVWNLAVGHVNNMCEEYDERVCILGADGTDVSVSYDQLISYAEGLSDENAWLVGPGTFKMRNPMTNAIDVVPGYYAAAAVAGYESRVPTYTPLTQKTIMGLYGANELYSRATKRNVCANGVMYVDESGANMRILHGRTTSNASIIERESNIVLTKHHVIKTVRSMFDDGYIGSVINQNTLISIKSGVENSLASMQSQGYMSSYGGITVEQDAANLTQVNVSFEYVPTYSLNYIEISFSIDGTTSFVA